MVKDVRGAFDRGRAAWPRIDLDEATFAAHVLKLDDAGDHETDLYLACACAHGVCGAADALDRHFFGAVASYVARVDGSPAFVDEVRQQLRERLLLAASPDQPPRIAMFSGRGPLGGWLRVAALRVALDLKRKRSQPAIDMDTLLGASVHEPGPERALLLARYGGAYADALRTALACLSARERNLLRLSVLQGVSSERLGEIYRVHKTTSARWVREARQKLIDELFGGLRTRLQLEETELRSLAGSFVSQLDVTLGELLVDQ